MNVIRDIWRLFYRIVILSYWDRIVGIFRMLLIVYFWVLGFDVWFEIYIIVGFFFRFESRDWYFWFRGWVYFYGVGLLGGVFLGGVRNELYFYDVRGVGYGDRVGYNSCYYCFSFFFWEVIRYFLGRWLRSFCIFGEI